jgi:hypothetical protein
MKILVACEESQAVTIELRKLGHEAFSCDLLPCSGDHPEWHFQQDAIEVMNGWFDTNEVTINDNFSLKFDVWSDEQEYEYKDKEDSKGALIKQIGWNWDMMIAFPPCTDLAVSGARHFERKQQDGSQQKSIEFFMEFVNAPIEKIAIENPIGIMSKLYRKPNQIIQPYEFGDKAQKSTCLWLKNLPNLQPTNIVDKGEFKEWICNKTGKKKKQALWYYEALINSKTPEQRRTLRSKTFLGIAKAMAEQWTVRKKERIQLTLF